MMRGAGFAAGWADLGALALFSAFTLTLAAVRLKRSSWPEADMLGKIIHKELLQLRPRTSGCSPS